MRVKPPSWQTSLLKWFNEHQRILPWRSDPSPYRVWISEIMLQQTQVATVTPYFERFVVRFPDCAVLAEAELEDVLKVWEGLGYYSRARNLHRAARLLLREYGGVLPDTVQGLTELPGIGAYTATAILSIAHGIPVPVVDGNVLRVFCRFWGIKGDIRLGSTKKSIAEKLGRYMDKNDPSSFNQAMMELGALVCKPRNPSCTDCPLGKECKAKRLRQVEKLPVKSKRAPVPRYTIAVGLIWNDRGDVLIARRGDDGMLGGLWEFPGGRREGDEPLEKTAAREIREETGLEVTVTRQLCSVKHAYSHFKVTITAFHCRITGGELRIHRGRPHRWIPPADFDTVPFPQVNHKIIAALRTE